MKRFLLIPAAALALAFSACEDESTIGSSIVDDDLSIVVDSSFTISGQSVDIDAVQSRTLTQLIGRLESKGFGSLTSSVVTQFMPASVLDTVGITIADIDSLKLVLSMGKNAYTGDSIVPMGIDVYRLNRELPSPIYSNFNPAEYYSPDDLLGSAIYSPAAIGQSDSIAALAYRTIEVRMPKALAEEIFTAYKNNPSDFASPEVFTRNVFPGVYIANSYGNGRVSRITQTMMQMYYHRSFHNSATDRDTTIYSVGNYLAVTPEVVTNNNINLRMSENIQSMLDAGDKLMVAPAGVEVEMVFPAQEIIDSYRAGKGDYSVVNTLSMTLPADTLSNPEGIPAPDYALLVLASKKEEFFASNSLPDNKTSFYAAYDRTNRCYTFSGLRQYIIDLMDKEQLTADDVTFRLCPVDVQFESTGSSYWDYGSTESAVVPYVEGPAMVKISLDKAKISFTYSNQTINY
ncbi:MAG: DUF4270 domain-containing protein [Muribaculaceae bacterium]|nr:DUF4270 domain-containing protein [Muribaculaceae bacterium]